MFVEMVAYWLITTLTVVLKVWTIFLNMLSECTHKDDNRGWKVNDVYILWVIQFAVDVVVADKAGGLSVQWVVTDATAETRHMPCTFIDFQKETLRYESTTSKANLTISALKNKKVKELCTTEYYVNNVNN